MACATYAHCLASVMYHIQCAYRSCCGGDFDHFMSPFRVLDVTLIHTCCFAYGFALSRGDLLFNGISFLANLVCVTLLQWRMLCSVPGTTADSLRVVGCIIVYTMPMFMRGDMMNYLGMMLAYCLGGCLFSLNERLNGWGVGLFHAMLLPCTHFILQSAAAA